MQDILDHPELPFVMYYLSIISFHLGTELRNTKRVIKDKMNVYAHVVNRIRFISYSNPFCMDSDPYKNLYFSFSN